MVESSSALTEQGMSEERFDQIEHKLDVLADTIGALGVGVYGRLTQADERFDRIDQRFDQVTVTVAPPQQHGVDHLVGILVHQGDRGAEFYLLAAEFAHIDDVSAADLVLELAQAPFDETLAFARSVILGIFREVAMFTRLGNGADNRWPLYRLQMSEFFFQTGIAVRCHRNSLHRNVNFS